MAIDERGREREEKGNLPITTGVMLNAPKGAAAVAVAVAALFAAATNPVAFWAGNVTGTVTDRGDVVL